MIKFGSDVMDRNYDVINFILRKHRVAIFADIIKIATMSSRTCLLKTISLQHVYVLTLIALEIIASYVITFCYVHITLLRLKKELTFG